MLRARLFGPMTLDIDGRAVPEIADLRPRSLLAWLLMIVWASAGAEVTRYVDVEPGSYLNVREGPGTSEPVLYTLEAGSFVTVLTEDGGWVKLRTSRGHGWALGSYLVEMPAWLEVEEDPPGGV